MENEITIILIGKNKKKLKNDMGIDIVLYDDKTKITELLEKIKTKYVAFVDENDEITDNYFIRVSEMIKNEFDSCYINNSYIGTKNKRLMSREILNVLTPLSYEYIWSYIFNREKLIEVLQFNSVSELNRNAIYIFENRQVITEIIYHHNIEGKEKMIDFYCVRKKQVRSKNMVYVGDFCNILFNGYITWLVNLGKLYSKDHEMMIVYSAMPEPTYEKLSTYYDCSKYSNKYLYVCDSLICIYGIVHYPQNIAYYNQSFMFIHGVLEKVNREEDFYRYKKDEDMYDRYIAVSKTAAEAAKEYYPGKIEYILNPLVPSEKETKRHLRLVSAQRYDSIKRFDRLEMIANYLSYLEIPYTWNLFTNERAGKNQKGLIFRESVQDVRSYVEDAHFVVILSDSEACSYIALEAISSHTKIIATPLKQFEELGLEEEKDVFYIPFEYFERENERKLVNRLKEIYEKIDVECNYDFSKIKYDAYDEVFS